MKVDFSKPVFNWKKVAAMVMAFLMCADMVGTSGIVVNAARRRGIRAYGTSGNASGDASGDATGDATKWTVTLSETSFVYDGQAKEPDVDVKDGSKTVLARNYEVTYVDNTNAGTAKAVVTSKVTGFTNTKKEVPFTITKANAEITASDIRKKVGDADFAVGARVTPENAGTLTYSCDKREVATIVNGKVHIVATEAATAKITVSLEADNYEATPKTINLTITKDATGGDKPGPAAKKDQTITASDVTVEAGKTVDLKATALGGATLTYAAKDKAIATVDNKGVVTGVKAGSTDITITAAENAQYKSATKTVKVTVTAAKADPTKPDPAKPEPPKAGTTVKSSTGTYKFAANGQVTLSKPKNKKVTTAKIPDTVTVNGVKYPVTSIANNAYKGCAKLKTVTVGKNVKTIGAGSFQNCKKLKSIKGCKNITSIGKNAFAGCTSLKTVSLSSKKLTTIGASAFSGNKALTKVTISSTKVKSIGSKAFNGCAKLKTITLKTTALKTVQANAFKGINKNATIKVPAKKLKAYKKLFTKKTGFKSTMKLKK